MRVYMMDIVMTEAEFGPIYARDEPLDPDFVEVDSGHLCINHGAYCYLHYEFSREAFTDDYDDSNTADQYAELVECIRFMVRAGKDYDLIVPEVQRIYNENIRKTCQYTNPVTGVLDKNPEWSQTSIREHLIFSGEFPELFERYQNRIYQTITRVQFQHLRNNATNELDGDRVKQLLDTMSKHTNWKRSIEQSRLNHHKLQIGSPHSSRSITMKSRTKRLTY